jgi:zinc transport system substrate-binding protein
MMNRRQMMRACTIISILAVGVVMILVGCSKKEEAESIGTQETAESPVVQVSNYPLEYMAKRIAGPLIAVGFSIPAGVDPAFWKPVSKDILAMQDADLVVLNGAQYESWLATVSLAPSKLVDTTAALTDRLVHLEETEIHSHGPKGEHEHAGTAFTTWLDPTMAIEQARAIKDAFSRRWPEHGDRFEAEFDKLTSDLAALDAELKKIVGRNTDRAALFSHPVYQYLARRYGINGRSVHFEPDAMPNDAAWQELSDLVADHPAKWMIWEGKPLPEIAKRLRSMGIESVVFNPCGGTPEQGDFLSVMRRNLADLERIYERQ